MTGQSYQQRDPTTISAGWETAAFIGAAAATALALAALLGLGTSAALFGHGWVWPTDATTQHALAGLLSGHPRRELPASAQARVPGPQAIYACVAASELLAVALIAAGMYCYARYRVPGDARRGMATRSQTRDALGVQNLRAAAPIIRPDLQKKQRRRSSSGRRGTPIDVGWRLGTSGLPHGVPLWVRYDRTTGIYGAQGSGKTLDLLAPALLAHPGAALVTLTKLDDLLLTVRARGKDARPVVVLDPFGMAPGEAPLLWDPIVGCTDPLVAERRAKAFAAGTITGSVAGGHNDNAARFYAAETAKVLQGFLHAAALTGRSLEHVLAWVANPVAAEQPIEILAQHPHAAPFWDGLLAGALHGSADTVGNTVTTVQQAMSLFYQPSIRARCVPAIGQPGTDLAEVISRRGTIYLLGREDPYASASPLMTAVAEHILDVVLWQATTAKHGRITPSFLACLDELPSTAPLPTLRVRMANERALGLSFMYAAQTWRQMVVCYGEDEARSLFGLTNNLVVFGGGKDIHFYKEISDLLGTTRVARRTITHGPGGAGTSRASEDVPILRPEQIRLIPHRQALLVAENAPPVLAALRRCIDGKTGRALLAQQQTARQAVIAARTVQPAPALRDSDAHAWARAHRLHPDGPHQTLTNASRAGQIEP
jgi:type IV secretion system protein VirD4